MDFNLTELQSMTKRSYRQLQRYIEDGRIVAMRLASGEYSISAAEADRLLRDLNELDEAFVTVANASGNKYTPAFLRYVFDTAEAAIVATAAGRNVRRFAVAHEARLSLLVYWLAEHPYHADALRQIETWLAAIADDVCQSMHEDLVTLEGLRQQQH